jgi:hypothetical protein
MAGRWSAEDLLFLGVEFGLGQDALGFEFAELFELFEFAAHVVGGWFVGGGPVVGLFLLWLLFLFLLLVLVGPAAGLAAGDTVRDGGGGARGDGDTGNPTE